MEISVCRSESNSILIMFDSTQSELTLTKHRWEKFEFEFEKSSNILYKQYFSEFKFENIRICGIKRNILRIRVIIINWCPLMILNFSSFFFEFEIVSSNLDQIRKFNYFKENADFFKKFEISPTIFVHYHSCSLIICIRNSFIFLHLSCQCQPSREGRVRDCGPNTETETVRLMISLVLLFHEKAFFALTTQLSLLRGPLKFTELF